MKNININRLKTVLTFTVIASCLFFSACTALQEAQQRREARLMKKENRQTSREIRSLKSPIQHLTTSC